MSNWVPLYLGHTKTDSCSECVIRRGILEVADHEPNEFGPKQSNQATARPFRQIRNFTTQDAEIASTDLERERYQRASLAAGCVRVEVNSVRSYHPAVRFEALSGPPSGFSTA